jgi:hypothetical protein
MVIPYLALQKAIQNTIDDTIIRWFAVLSSGRIGAVGLFHCAAFLIFSQVFLGL